MTTGPIPLCASCARLGPRADGQFGLACAAFPDGIPEAIMVGGFDHRHPFDGDGGIRYLQAEGDHAARDLAAYEGK